VDGRTYGRTFETHFTRSTRKGRPNKLAPYGLAVDSYLLPTSKSHDTKNRTKIKKIGPR